MRNSVLRFLCLSALCAALLPSATGALADCGSGGATVPEGRSPVPTCPMISWEEQRALAAAWPNAAPDASEPSTPPQAQQTPETPESPETNDGAADGHYTPPTATSQEQNLYELVNAERKAAGLDALPLDEALSALAREKSQDMVDNHYFAHESPTLGSASEMLDAAGYDYVSVGENIARSASVEKAHVALMSSANHRRAILGAQWTRVGIGIANDANGYPYVTELFAR